MTAITLSIVAIFDTKQGNKIGLIPKGVQFEYIKKDTTWLQRKDGTWDVGGNLQSIIGMLTEIGKPRPSLEADGGAVLGLIGLSDTRQLHD